MGGAASCGNAERPGPHQDLRHSATATGAGATLSHEDVNLGTRETDHSARGEAVDRGVEASIPPRSAPAEYTKFFVNNAIAWYETQGRDATLTSYNREESVDGQWYVFIIDEIDLVIGHPDTHRLGLHLKRWGSLDATGYNFGPDMLSATEEGVRVNHEDVNPATGEVEDKHFWLVVHDGLVFGSGWHHDESGS